MGFGNNRDSLSPSLLSLGRMEMDWEDWLLHWFTGRCMAQRKQSKLVFVLVLFFCFFLVGRGGGLERQLSLIFCWKERERIHSHSGR